MLKFLLVMVFLTSTAFNIELDPKMLQEIIDKNPHAQKEKILLAKYFMSKDNDLKALTLLEGVLNDNNKDNQALKLKKRIEIKQENRELFRKIGLQYPPKKNHVQKALLDLYNKNEYQQYIVIYNAMNEVKVVLDDSYHINAAYILLWDGKYEESKYALEHISQNNNLDKVKIEADICYYTGKYACAIELLEKLYALDGDINTGIKLVYSYMYMGDLGKAKHLYNELFKKDPENKELQGVKSKVSDLKSKRLATLKEIYEEKRDFKSLSEYCNLLYSLGFKQETLDVLNSHNVKYATTDSLMLEASYLSWTDHMSKALNLLEPLANKNNTQAKLLIGKIYSWQNEFELSKKYLTDVIKITQSKEELYDARKALAFVYMWKKNTLKAKTLFAELYKENNEDDEVIEALMELNGDYEGLINRYEKKSGGGGGKRLSELYNKVGKKDKSLEALKKYVIDNPKDLEATKRLALLLLEYKEYYTGFGNLEYYAAQKNDSNSSLLLAQNYYWHGFSQEAVEVLDKLLIIDPENDEAVELRAKILKVSPRFTRSNSGATINDHFEEVGLKQLEIADALYFNGHHASSLMYYENYLKDEPRNHDVRLRYAFALENAGNFAKAEGEFFLMLWTDKTDEIKYHYGYNLMMNNKLDKAEEVFLELKKNTYKKVSTQLFTFLKSWKNDWESMDYNKYIRNYASSIQNDENWALSKQQSFKNVTFISVGLYDTVYKRSENKNTYIVKTYEEVATSLGTNKGYKTFEINCATSNECFITEESFTEGKYEKFTSLEPIINQRLKDIKTFRKNPRLYNKIKRKKKSL